MLSNISWTTYFISVAIAVTIWYIIIGIKYYLDDLHSFFKKLVFAGDAKDRQISDDNVFDEVGLYNENADITDAAIQELISRVENAIAEASDQRFNKAEFTYSIQKILRQYPAVKESSYQSSIEQLIQLELQRYGLMSLDADELAMLWNEG